MPCRQRKADLMIEQRHAEFLNEAEASGLVEPKELFELTLEGIIRLDMKGNYNKLYILQVNKPTVIMVRNR